MVSEGLIASPDVSEKWCAARVANENTEAGDLFVSSNKNLLCLRLRALCPSVGGNRGSESLGTPLRGLVRARPAGVVGSYLSLLSPQILTHTDLPVYCKELHLFHSSDANRTTATTL